MELGKQRKSLKLKMRRRKLIDEKLKMLNSFSTGENID